jgi:threonine dehydrogenase-like Zn-dependent dehydrogenase
MTGTTGASLADYETAVRLILQKKVNVTSLISKQYAVGQVQEAFAFARSGEGLKTLLSFD